MGNPGKIQKRLCRRAAGVGGKMFDLSVSPISTKFSLTHTLASGQTRQLPRLSLLYLSSNNNSNTAPQSRALRSVSPNPSTSTPHLTAQPPTMISISNSIDSNFSFVRQSNGLKLVTNSPAEVKTVKPSKPVEPVEPTATFYCKYLGEVESSKPFPKPGVLSPEGFVSFSAELASIATQPTAKPRRMSMSASQLTLSDDTLNLVDTDTFENTALLSTKEILSFKAVKAVPGVKSKGVSAVALVMAKSEDETVVIHRLGFGDSNEVVRFFHRLRTAFATIYRNANPEKTPESNEPAPPVLLTDDTEC